MTKQELLDMRFYDALEMWKKETHSHISVVRIVNAVSNAFGDKWELRARYTVRDVAALSLDDLKRTRCVGAKAIDAVRQFLACYKLSLQSYYPKETVTSEDPQDELSNAARLVLHHPDGSVATIRITLPNGVMRYGYEFKDLTERIHRAYSEWVANLT